MTGPKACSVEDCTKPFHCRDLCKMHYTRLLRHGDPLIRRTGGRTVPVEERLWSRVEKTATCWLWRGPLNAGGYGLISWFPVAGGPMRKINVHRLSYILTFGDPGRELQIDHLCRVRNCVRPDHLEAVTQQENIRRGDAGKPQSQRTHCPKGHPYSGDNLAVTPKGRECRACRHLKYVRRRDAARRASEAA